MRLEQDNCRAALEFLLQAEDAAGALRLATALGYFWYLTGQLRESQPVKVREGAFFGA